jgi:hypothetical protein
MNTIGNVLGSVAKHKDALESVGEIRRESHVTGRITHTVHEHGVELERRVSAVRGRNNGINKGLKASQL